MQAIATQTLPRIELFRALSDAGRLRVLALCHEEELSVSELAEAVQESQPQVSKKTSALKKLGLLNARKEGTRTFLKSLVTQDAVVLDALREGKRLCLEDGALVRAHNIVRARDEHSVAFFDDEEAHTLEPVEQGPFLSHLAAFAPLFANRKLAIDVGCGKGRLIDVLAPVFERVIAVDRSRAQLSQASARIKDRAFTNVSLVHGAYDNVDLIAQSDRLGGADLVFAGRVLHHAPKPSIAMQDFARLLKKGGHLIVLDYMPHTDDKMREEEADVWLGFSKEELTSLAQDAALKVCAHNTISPAFHRTGKDAHLMWHTLVAQKPAAAELTKEST